ncbi:HelD family protein [Actinokineospora diospyrosa]|uniref:DNA helicase IV n=1 Tax=Actinokineospora diospyrosa TaxID=103728 RepID=A0ABT1I952_9PSEU|nr:AAA family ATPase [Actinokineospora diospyrosa]MCP2269154.1 DNA helicase IV [Actinokineospora diospyrosa]
MSGDRAPAGRAELEAERAHLTYAVDCLRRSRTELLEMAERAMKTSDDELVIWLLRRAQQIEQDDGLPLFFGRMELDDSDVETVYVGRRHVGDPRRDGEIVVTDWRTPLAARFYRASRAEPMGVLRKRRFGFAEDGALTSFDDEPVRGADGGLSALVRAEIERPRFGPMRDIVATIQPDQDEIVRGGLADTLLIQGGPGTGKTAVGLHRAAYLLFEHSTLHRRGVLVVGPNDVFVRYIARVLPALGETDVRHVALEQLTAPKRAPVAEPPEVARIKGDARMVAVVSRAMAAKIGAPTEDLLIRETSPFVRVSPETVADLAADLIGSRVAWDRARAHLTDRLVDHIRRRLELRGRAPSDAEMRRVARTKGVRAVVAAIWPPVKPEQVLRELLSDPAVLAAAAEGILDEAERGLLARASTKWSAADLYLLDEISAHLREPDRHGHVVVDEAQDLSALQLRAIGRRCVDSATVLGDMAQRTTPWAAGSWDAVREHLGLASRVLTLSRSYRVPAEVLAVANRLLPLIAPDLPPTRSVRHAPGSFTTTHVPDVPAALIAAITADPTPESTGVIVRDDQRAQVRRTLTTHGITVADSLDDTGTDVTLIPAGLAKGLEFDHVYVLEPADIIDTGPDGLRLLYIALTRAVSRLTVLHTRDLPEVLTA